MKNLLLIVFVDLADRRFTYVALAARIITYFGYANVRDMRIIVMSGVCRVISN